MAGQRHSQSITAINLGLAVNIVLAAVKTTIGVLGHSPALLADGINSTSDVAYLVVVRIFMVMARKPADRQHPYGHSQLESIAALVVGSFVIATAITIFWDSVNSVHKVISGQDAFSGAALIALWVALATVVIKIALMRYTQGVGARTSSLAISALAHDHRNDIFSASAAAIGITFGRLGYPWVDPLVGALVALLILRTGVEILRESSESLMDAVPSDELAAQIHEYLHDIPGLEEVEEIRAHRFGPYLVLTITIGVDGQISVASGDLISQRVELRLYDSIDTLRSVVVHYHPTGSPEPRPLITDDADD